MPLMPAMRPFSSTSIAAAMPIRTPPASEVQGVKCVQSMVISILLPMTIRNAALAVLLSAAVAAAAQSPHTHKHSFGDAEKWAQVFDDPERDAWQKPHEVIRALALKPDAVVADLGAGTGYFAARLAKMLPKGAVYAVDVEPEMVKYLGERAKREALPNLRPVAAGSDDARVPAKVDLILLVDVYHHIEARERYFRELAASLKPGGRLAVIDFRLDSPEGPPKASRVAPQRVKAELAKAGYVLHEEHGFLPRQYFLVFRVVIQRHHSR
jgi:predicted methyltransferase